MADKLEAAGSQSRTLGRRGQTCVWPGKSLWVVLVAWHCGGSVTRISLSNTFAPKASRVFGKSDLKGLWVSATWEDVGTVSCPEAVCLYHPVLVKVL